MHVYLQLQDEPILSGLPFGLSRRNTMRLPQYDPAGNRVPSVTAGIGLPHHSVWPFSEIVLCRTRRGASVAKGIDGTTGKELLPTNVPARELRLVYAAVPSV